MTADVPPCAAPSLSRARGWRAVLPLALVLGLTVAAYAPSFRGVMLLDDRVRLPQIVARSCWQTFTQSSRPLTDLTLQFNDWISGDRPWSYHVFNVLVHLAAGVVLAALVSAAIRRRRAVQAASGPGADAVALVVAAIWLLHPLQTESVTYIIQRAESLAALFTLLALYARVRADTANSGRWLALSVVACALAMLSKPVALVAPVLIVLVERLLPLRSGFVSPRARFTYRAGLLSAMLMSLVLLATGNESTASAGFAANVATPLQYAMTQPGVILHGLRLALWPVGLCLDYGWPLAPGGAAVWVPALVMLGLGLVIAWACRRGHPAALPALLAVVALAPTSSVIPVADAAADHRLYLPLAGLSVLAVLALARATARRPALFLVAGAGIAIMLAVLTVQRNQMYTSERAMWTDVVRQRPENCRARLSLARACMEVGDARAAADQCLQVLARLDGVRARNRDQLEALYRQPGGTRVRYDVVYYTAAHNLIGVTLAASGEEAMAIPHFQEALRLLPEFAMARDNLDAARRAMAARHSQQE